MNKYKIVGIDLAKRSFALAAINSDHEVTFKRKISRDDFFSNVGKLFPGEQVFAFEACGGSHHIGQFLEGLGHKVILLKAKDVKAFAKIKQKNDINDAIAICRAACDPELMRVHLKSKREQKIAYLHKTRQNAIRQRIQRSNSIMTSLHEFGYVVTGGKTNFAKNFQQYLDDALAKGAIEQAVYDEMNLDGAEIKKLIEREKNISKHIVLENKGSETAKMLEKIPGIGPINASILSNKPMALYNTAKDFSASLGIVPRQDTTGGKIKLGSITKQGDRYARTMLIQAGRAILMRVSKKNPPQDDIYLFALRMLKSGKHFNVACVAVANKLARIAYACVIKKVAYNGSIC